MPKRAEFLQAVKQALADRAGHRCSFPRCDAITIGPSAEGPTSTTATGMACHIYAAADGPPARRRNPELSFDELRSVENGIWMCYTDGKLIDADECTYTPEMLRHWRRIAENKARIRQQFGSSVRLSPQQSEGMQLLNLESKLSPLANFNEEVERLYFASCVSDIWGEDAANSIREFTVELARNAFEHGRARKFVILIEGRRITLRDDGTAFSLFDLRDHPQKRGGAAAVTQIVEHFANELICSYVRESDQNVTILARITEANEICTLTPCSVEFTIASRVRQYEDVFSFCDVHRECGTVYLVPKHTITHSDIMMIADKLHSRLSDDQAIVLVCGSISQGLADYAKKVAPNLRLMRLPNY